MYAILTTIAVVIVFFLALVAATDRYLILRRRWLFAGNEPPSPPQAGIDVKGELTTGAKYAIWSYMFRILGIGGTIIGVISGLVGYMVNDLAKEKATQKALDEVQAPLIARLGQLENARAQLDVVAHDLATDTFGGRDVGAILISEGLAHPYVCGATTCPQRRPWCEGR